MKRLAALASALVLLAGCGDRDSKDAVPPPTVKDRNTIVFAAGSPQLAQIRSLPIEPRREMTVHFNGRLVWNEDRTVRVLPPFAGRVVSIEVRAGDRVEAGQTLAVLAAPDFGVAQSEARKAEQDYALAQKNLNRIQELFKAGVSPAKDLQVAQADVARTAAERARTRERLKLYGKTDTVDQRLALKSPLAGVVVERNLNPGQELRPDTMGDKALFVVSDPSNLWFFLDVAEKDVGSVKPGTEVRITTASLGSDRVVGKVSYVADVVDPQTRTVKVRGTLDGADERLKAEMYIVAKVHLPASTGFLVPMSAVYLRGEQYFVFLDQGKGTFVRRGVRPGPVSEGQQVVLDGLSASDRVVVDGSLLLERLLASRD
jgi:membrane fusion protein, heavy metal efflux system